MPSPTTVLLRTQSDDRLVALTRSGHERAFEAIVERYRRPLLRACRRVLPEARAEDAVQQALVAAWNGLSRGDEVRELRPWLYRIAHNTALNQLRVAGYDYEELHGLLAAGPGPEEELERREVARRTLTGLATLPERQRAALLAIAVQGRGQDEVAVAMGISEPAVRQLVHRARTQLRAAATALTPWPLAGWLAEGGRVADLAAGGGSAGVAASLAKLSAVAVIAGGAAVGGPSVVDHFDHGSPRRPVGGHAGAAAAVVLPRGTVADAVATPAATPFAAVRAALTPAASHRAAAPAAPQRSRGSASRRGDDRGPSSSSGSSGDDRFSGGTSGGPSDDRRSSTHEGSSGPGPGGSDDTALVTQPSASPSPGSESSGSPVPDGGSSSGPGSGSPALDGGSSGPGGGSSSSGPGSGSPTLDGGSSGRDGSDDLGQSSGHGP